jgi:hypothetical protein
MLSRGAAVGRMTVWPGCYYTYPSQESYSQHVRDHPSPTNFLTLQWETAFGGGAAITLSGREGLMDVFVTPGRYPTALSFAAEVT